MTSANDSITVPVSNGAISSIDNFLNGDNELNAQGAIYEITSEIDANTSLPLEVGNFALIGDNVDGWKLYPLNVSDPDNLITDGTPISLTNTEKANFDSLSLSSSTTFTLGSIPFNAGFSNANLSLIGLQSSAMDLIGDLSSIYGALGVIGLKGETAGISNVTVNARDTLGLSATSKSFEVSFGIGDPSKPDVPNNITTGVSVDELIAGFPINVSIQGTGVKAGDTISLVSSYNRRFANVDEITLLESDVLNGRQFYNRSVKFS